MLCPPGRNATDLERVAGGEADHAARPAARRHVGESLFNVVDSDSPRHQRLEIEPAVEGQLDEHRDVTRRIGRAIGGRRRKLRITAPTPVVTAQPSSAARSSGSDGSTFTTAAAGASVCSASVPAPIDGHTPPSALEAYGPPNAC
jgi:hypothetical protein